MMEAFVFIFGTIIGSFLNVVILRLPKDEPLTGRSHCTHCGHILGPVELVPVFSYLFLLGKCRKCKAKISPRYFIIEIITGLLFLLGWMVLLPHSVVTWVIYLEFLLLASVVVITFVVDLEHYFIIGNLILVSAAIIFAANLGLGHGHFLPSLIGALIGALPLFLVWVFPPRGQWMGFGDVELMVLLGAAVGFPLVLVNLMLAVFGGGAVSLVLLAFTKKTLSSRIPFGTLLGPAALVTFLYGHLIVHWYLGLLGF